MNKIKELIRSFRFKKYSHFKSRLDEIKNEFNIRLFWRQFFINSLVAYSKSFFQSILVTPVNTEEEKINKKKALVECLINMANGITRICEKY